MKRDYTLTANECQYMTGKRYEMGLKMFELEQLTGYPAYYERQGYNGIDGSNWIVVGVGNPAYNKGDGFPIGVEGYNDAIDVLGQLVTNYIEHGALFHWEVK